MYVFSRPRATIIMLRRLFLSLVVALGACAPGGENPEDTAEVPPPPSAAADAESPAQAPDDRPVVVFLGTSLTAGLGLLREEDTFVAQLAELADSAGLPFRAVNAGVSGETSAAGLRRVDWVLREPLDVLVLELGANDGLRGQDPVAMESNLRGIITATRSRYPGARVLLAGMEAPPNLGEEYGERFRQTFVTVARSEGAILIPFLLDGVAGVTELNQSDRIHPSSDGHARIARTVWESLQPVLLELAARQPGEALP
jgi:acyl-CoA thioesterase-1